MKAITENYTSHIIEIKKLWDIQPHWLYLHYNPIYDSGNIEEGAAEKIMRVRIPKGLFVVKRSLVEMAAYTRLEQ